MFSKWLCREASVNTVSLREIKFFVLDPMSSFHKMIAEKVIGGVSVKKHCFLLTRDVQASQRSIALIAEMIHTASLVHDDVIDDASSRRGKRTVNKIWGEKKVCFFFLFFPFISLIKSHALWIAFIFQICLIKKIMLPQMWSSHIQNSIHVLSVYRYLMIDNTVEKLSIPAFSQFSIESLLVIREGISVVIQKAHFVRNQTFYF